MAILGHGSRLLARANDAGADGVAWPWAAPLVFAGCFLGARLGTWLTFPVVGAAALFAPYAVLAATLLVAPRRHVWIYLLASSLGNYLPHHAGGANLGFIMGTEVANYARALVAVAGMRALGFKAHDLDDLRGMTTFLVFAAALGPVVGAALGALVVVHAGRSDDYWLCFAEWCLSNTLTAVTLLPLILSGVQQPGALRPAATLARRLEAVALLLCVLAASAATFVLYSADPRTLPLTLYLPLPILLWCAVRFDAVFTSAALMLVAFITIWGALHGSGPFVAASPTQNLLHLQLFLVALALPLLLLSALVQQARRTATELRASREQYRSVVEDQTEMICRIRLDGTYAFVNAAYAAFFGRTPEAFAGRTLRAVLPPDSWAATEARIAAITADTPVVTREIDVTDGSGARRWQQWRDRGLFDDKGRIVEYQSVGRDITDRRRADEEALRVAAQTEIAHNLREADRRKDEFLALLGHELRNPLAPIGLALETLRPDEPAGDDVRHAHAVIDRQVDHMTRLLEDLLDVSRITRGVIELRLASVDLRDAVAQALETAKPAIDARRHKLAVVTPAGPLWVQGDVARLSQIIANLLHNAAKYTEPGGRIELALRREGARHVVSVRDDGVGISAELLARIFDLFTQAPRRGDTAPGGLGVGLTLAQRLAELHGGSIEAHSEGRDRGSEFRLKLPAIDGVVPAQAAQAPTAFDTRAETLQLRILIVDDNIDAAEALATLLARWGHDARIAHDGEAGLAAVAAAVPDLVLLDLDLPRLDGYEVARRLRAAHGPRLLLVALSGFGQQHHVDRAREVGFDRHVVKPLGVPALRGLLAWSIALRRS